MLEKSMLDLVDNIVDVVYCIHFYYIRDAYLKEDLKQEGYLKAYELLSTGNYDPNKSLRNYLFTGVRNAMTNYMYHAKKDMHTSLDTFECNIDAPCGDFCDYEIAGDIILLSCKKYMEYGNYFNIVVDYFNGIGLKINRIEGLVGPTIVNNMIFKAIVAGVIWDIGG